MVRGTLVPQTIWLKPICHWMLLSPQTLLLMLLSLLLVILLTLLCNQTSTQTLLLMLLSLLPVILLMPLCNLISMRMKRLATMLTLRYKVKSTATTVIS